MVFSHMKDSVMIMYPGHKVIGEHYLLSIGESKNCEAYKILSELMLSERLDELWNWCIDRINSVGTTPSQTASYDETFDRCLKKLSKDGKPISSGRFLCSILYDNPTIAKKFSGLGVTPKQIEHEIIEFSDETKPKENTQKKETPYITVCLSYLFYTI